MHEHTNLDCCKTSVQLPLWEITNGIVELYPVLAYVVLDIDVSVVAPFMDELAFKTYCSDCACHVSLGLH